MNQVLKQQYENQEQHNDSNNQYELIMVRFFLDILNELDSKVDSHSVILDFGCGEGWAVYQYRKMGLQAFGVDIINSSAHVQKLCKKERLVGEDEDIFRTIDMDNYRIPFDDDTFDFVMSDQVFEHVQNWPEALAEIKRVLKPGGSSLHCFPSRYRPVEAHVFVPFAGIFRHYAYLTFWAYLGIRNSFQQRLSWKRVADLNFEYLRTCTRYYPRAKIRKLVAAEFGNMSFVEAVFIKNHFGRVRQYLAPLSSKLPFISSLFSMFHSRVIFFRKKETGDREIESGENNLAVGVSIAPQP
jgi:SAM-dependent methyltransferase